MAGENRTETDRLELYRELEENSSKYSFFQALRRIECANPNKEKLGRSVKPSDDPVRLGQEPSLAFAPSTIASFSAFGENDVPRLNVLFFGLFGPNGPLPLHLTEFTRERIRNFDDEGISRFADIFHHRLLSLFYRAWAEAQPVTHLDRPNNDRLAERLGSLIGVGSSSLRGQDAMPDYAKLAQAGRFVGQSRNAEGLLSLVKNFFGMSATLEQYIGTWFDIPGEDQMRLGESLESGSLGVNSSLGAKAWECQSKFRLTFGPLSMEEYKRMLPGGDSLARLVSIVKNYLGDEFDWDVHLILNRTEIKSASLGEFGQLGWTTWMAEEYPNRDFSDLYFNSDQASL